MKAIFIAYYQAYGEEIVGVLEENGQRGYTRWEDIRGRGHIDGLPHMGNHAWPAMNAGLLAVVPDDKAAPILEQLRAKDEATPGLGLRAFTWNVEDMI